MTIGERIKALRKSNNLTQEKLGKKLGVQKATIQKYENGSIINLKTELVEELAKIFNVSPSYILGWEYFDIKYDSAKLKNEVIFLERMHDLFGPSVVDFYKVITQLNRDGFYKVYSYAEDLNEISKFRK